MWRVFALLAAPLLALTVAADAGAPRFGPKEYVRGPGAPVTVTEPFEICLPERSFTLRVENGPRGRARVSSAVVAVNGMEVIRERDLNQQVGVVEVPVPVRSQNTLTVRLAGQPGGLVAVIIASKTDCLELEITSPAPGAEVLAGPLLVRGTVRGAAGVGVAVNGMPALVESETFVGQVPVDPSVPELVAVARASDGTTAEARQPLSVVPGPEGLVQLRASHPGGLAPLATGFLLSSLVGISRVALDLGDGRPEFEGPSLDGQTFTYTQPGVYAPAVRVTDAQGQVHAAVTLVQVFDPVALDARLQAVWNGFKDAVRAGDLARAAGFLHSDTRAVYQAQLELLSSGTLANIDRFMTTIDLVEVGFGGAEYEMLRNRDGHTLSFAVWFQLDQDGLWRLRRF